MNRIFDYLNYKEYLGDLIDSSPNKGRGLRSRMAEKLKCKPSFIAQVIGGNLHFSLEQCDILIGFFGLSDVESEHFFDLVLYERAGSASLRDRIFKRLSQRREKQNDLKHLLESTDRDVPSDVARMYYANWVPSAIHILCSIPKFQTISQIAKQLGLSEEETTGYVEKLAQAKLVSLKETGVTPLNTLVHVGKDSPELGWHHQNWRLKAFEAYRRQNSADLHFTSVASLSMRDFQLIREELLNLIIRNKKRISDSTEEAMACILIDAFRVI